jgi:hypothetical protein
MGYPPQVVADRLGDTVAVVMAMYAHATPVLSAAAGVEFDTGLGTAQQHERSTD